MMTFARQCNLQKNPITIKIQCWQPDLGITNARTLKRAQYKCTSGHLPQFFLTHRNLEKKTNKVK